MQNQLEQYLDSVSRPLPESERLEWRLEAEQHLTALTQAFVELGHSPEEATELALEKFGKAEPLAVRMLAEANKSVPIPLSLRLVAALWLWGGLKPLLLFGLADHHPWFLLWGLLSLMIAVGLVRRHPFARNLALVWSAVVSLSIIPYLQALLSAQLAHVPYSSVSHSLDQLVLGYGQAALQVWLLTRPQVRNLFSRSRLRSLIWLRH